MVLGGEWGRGAGGGRAFSLDHQHSAPRGSQVQPDRWTESLILALPRAHHVALGPQLPSCGMGVMVSAPVFVRTERVYTALSTVPAHSRCRVFAGAGFSAVSCGEGRGDSARGIWAESRQTSSLPLSSPGPGAGRLTHCSPVFPFVKQESQ